VLRKWPSLNKQRVSASLGARPYMINEGTLDECIQEFMQLRETHRHLYLAWARSPPSRGRGSNILCTVIGMMKREPPFGMVLNRRDETVAYAALFSLVSSFNHSVPL
jgi:hypothetical protein